MDEVMEGVSVLKVKTGYFYATDEPANEFVKYEKHELIFVWISVDFVLNNLFFVLKHIVYALLAAVFWCLAVLIYYWVDETNVYPDNLPLAEGDAVGVCATMFLWVGAVLASFLGGTILSFVKQKVLSRMARKEKPLL